MRLKKRFFGSVFGLMMLVIVCGPSYAVDPVTLDFTLDVTMQYPVDVSMNPTEDPSEIAGFCSQSDLLYEGVKIGDFSGCWMLKEAFDPTRLYDDLDVSGTLSLPDLGQCTLSGQGITMTVGENPALGNLAARLITRLTDCTGALAGFEGLVYGGGTDNLYDQTFTSDNFVMHMYLQYLPE